MSSLHIRPCHADDAADIVTLWQRCDLVVPSNEPHHDIQRKRQFQPELFLVGTLESRVVATVMVGYEGHRGWINYLAVSPECQRQGFGRHMMQAAETALLKLGCPKINLQVRATNSAVIGFYTRLGYAIEDRVNMGKRIS